MRNLNLRDRELMQKEWGWPWERQSKEAASMAGEPVGLGRDPEQPWEEDPYGHLGKPGLRRCAKRQDGTPGAVSPLG